MPLVNTWIKNEDWDRYYQLASTKQWGEFVHNALNGVTIDSDHPIQNIILTDKFKKDYKEQLEEPQIRPLSEVVAEEKEDEPEEYDYYKDLVYDTASNAVFNKVTMQPELDITPQDVQILKERGQVE
jgi:hypothetical protein